MNELGAAIRGWRSRVLPSDVGLPVGGRRRAEGLRREELAMLAGISVDYVVRLEQGRADSPSVQVVAALARVLRLDDPAREHLHRLAGQTMPGPDRVPTHVPPSVQRLLDQLKGTPIGVFDAVHNLLAWNSMWAALLGDPTAWTERNLLRQRFLGGGGSDRVRHTPAQADAFDRGLAANLRRVAGLYPHDPGVARLIADLLTSEHFRSSWGEQAVGGASMAEKVVERPEVGRLTLSCDVLTVVGSDLMIVAYTAAPGTTDVERLQLLEVLGTQSLV